MRHPSRMFIRLRIDPVPVLDSLESREEERDHDNSDAAPVPFYSRIIERLVALDRKFPQVLGARLCVPSTASSSVPS